MTTSANSIFHFVRGGIRGACGLEDFRQHKILVIGMGIVGQQLLTMFCLDDVDLFFMDNSLVNYDRAHMVCPRVHSLNEQNVDIVINLDEGFVSIYDRPFALALIEEQDPYTQGIHAFYL